LWTPGGKLQEGESEEECLRRELKEEIWVKITELSFFKEYTWVSFYNPEIPLVQKIYIVSITWEIKPDAEIDNFVRLSREDFEQKRFTLIRWDQEEIIPDLIKGNIF
jgi:8-oxo-dGTP diphosphatase